jgi:hypothetical protein
MGISFTKLLRGTQQICEFLWRQHVKKRSSKPYCLREERRGEERRGEERRGGYRQFETCSSSSFRHRSN